MLCKTTHVARCSTQTLKPLNLLPVGWMVFEFMAFHVMGPMTLHHLRCCHVLCYEKANLLLTLLINPKYQTIYAYSYLSKAIKSFNYEGMMNLMKDIDFLTGKFFQTYL